MKSSPILFLLVLFLLPQAGLRAQEGDREKPRKGVIEMTDQVGEEEFKKLHELKEGAAPALAGEMVETAAGRAYLSLPKSKTPPKAGILVIHEWWGLNDHVKHWADRLAAEGFAALAVDLYGGKVASSSADAMKYMREASADPEAQLRLMNAGFDFLKKDERCKVAKIASIGWCFGGGRSLEAALAREDLDAAVIYYGRLVTEPEQLKKIKARVMGIFAVRDRGIPISGVAAFERGLLEAEVRHELHRYDADHAFANPSSARYDEKAAAAAWSEVRRFLRRSLAD